MRYQRSISRQFEGLLADPEGLGFLVAKAREENYRNTGIPLDIQLREGDEVSLYLGLTRLLTLSLGKRPATISVKADKRYCLSMCGLARKFDLVEIQDLKSLCLAYLESVEVAERHYRKEGRCQGLLSHHHGVCHRPGSWVIVDRDVNVAYDDATEKAKKCDAVGDLATTIMVGLSKHERERFPQKRNFGNELDILFWDPQRREIIVAEVKDGEDAIGVYLSPLQVACYRAIWERFIAEQPTAALEGLRGLLQQKQRLGLLPQDVPLPESRSDLGVRPVVVIQKPLRRSKCWTKLTIVKDAVMDQWKQGVPSRSRILDGLRIYEWTDSCELQDISDVCQGWRDE